MRIEFTLPIKLVPKDNQRGGWQKHFFKVTKPQREMAKWTAVSKIMVAQREQRLVATFPVSVQITRIAPKKLDVRDNLQSSAKPVIDGIADALGVRDDDPRITFLEVKQERGRVREYACRVEIVTAPLAPDATSCKSSETGDYEGK